MTKILICDDDNVSRMLLKEVLQKEHPDYTFLTASEGGEALNIVNNEIPDILLLDVIMPGKNGFEILTEIKKRENLKSIPVILITSLKDMDKKLRGFELGAADYLVKPINAMEARARVDAHLRIKQDQDRLKKLNETILRTQKALIENSKMAAVGNLAAGVAHEFNNILFIMNGYLQMYETYTSKEQQQKVSDIFKELVQRGGKIVNSLMDFVKKEQNCTKVDVKDLLEKDLLLLDKHFNDCEITVEKDIKNTVLLKCYSDQLSQVFINIMLNAVDAMKNRSERKLTVSVRNCKCSEHSCQIDNSRDCVKEQGCVVVEFKDTGGGIPQHIKDSIFNPFVTTKGVLGGGTSTGPGKGLGLFVSYGIIQKHNGFICVEPQDNKGSIFNIVLPNAGKNNGAN